MTAPVRTPGTRRIRTSAIALGTVVVITAGGSAAAQSSGLAGQPEEGIQIRAGLDIGYDSNVIRSAAAFLSSGRRSDVRATPDLTVTVNKALGQNSLILDANAGYDFYHRNSQLNRERLGLNADLGLVGGPCSLHLRPGIARAQSNLGEIIPINIPGERSVRNVQTTQRYGGELQCGDNYGLRPIILGEHAAGNNSEVLRRFSNYRTNTYGAGLAYGDPTYGEVSVRATKTDTSYPDRPAFFGPGDFSTKRFSIDVQRSIGSILSGSAGVSYVMVRPDQGSTARNFNGLGWNLGLALVPTPDLRLNLGTSRNITPSLGNASLYQVNRDYTVGADYALSERLTASVTGSITKVRYSGTQAILGPLLSESLAHTVRTSLAFKASQRLMYTLYGGYQDRTTNNTIYNYHSYFIGLRTSFAL